MKVPHAWSGSLWTCTGCGETHPDPCSCRCCGTDGDGLFTVTARPGPDGWEIAAVYDTASFASLGTARQIMRYYMETMAGI